MSSTPSIAKIAALVSNSGRANVLLSCSMALTTTELAFAAHVSPQTTSGHLANSENKRIGVQTAFSAHPRGRLYVDPTDVYASSAAHHHWRLLRTVGR
jgi:hypothetical protein